MEKTDKTRFASIYARTSSPNQRDNYSIDEQIYQAQKYCQQRGWIVKYVFVDECQSGKSIDGRPKFQLMMERAKEGNFSVIVIWKLDRFCRSLVDLVNSEKQLRANGVELCSVTEFVDTTTSVGRFNYRNLASAAELERELIGERARLGLFALARECKWPNAQPPFGYDKGSDGRLKVNPSKSKLVTAIFKRYIKEKSMPAVSFWLNNLDAMAKSSPTRIWTTRSVKNILCNRIYIGNYWVAGHKQQVDSLRIVPDALFNKSEKVMKRYLCGFALRPAMPPTRKQVQLEMILRKFQETVVQAP